MSFTYNNNYQPANLGPLPASWATTPVGNKFDATTPGIQAPSGQSGDQFTSSNPLYPTQATNPASNPAQPDLTMHNFNQLTPETFDTLRKQGTDIRGLVFDVDDTLSRFQLKDRTIPPELKDRLKTLQDKGYELGVVSNNPRKSSVLKLQAELAQSGINVAVISNAKKPGTEGLKMMQQHFNLDPANIMMVGDNPLTDVSGGQKAGFKTAKVDWFDNGTGHKVGMIASDLALTASQKVKSKVFPGLEKPPTLHPAKAIETQPMPTNSSRGLVKGLSQTSVSRNQPR